MVSPSKSRRNNGEDTSEYSLRRRSGKNRLTSEDGSKHDEGGVDGKGSSSSSIPKSFYHGWTVTGFPEAGMKGLAKSSIKSDIREIRETLVESELLQDEATVHNSGDDFAMRKVLDKKSKEGGKQQKAKKGDDKESGRVMFNEQRPGVATGTKYTGTLNFYYPFKKMKEWEELKDYLDFVNEQTYHSTRHAFIDKMEMLRIKREQQQNVLQALHEQFDERLRALADAEFVLDHTKTLVQNALDALGHFEERCSLLAKENERLRQQSSEAPSGEGVYGRKATSGNNNQAGANKNLSKGKTNRAKKKRRSPGLIDLGLREDEKEDMDDLDEEDQGFCESLAELREVNTVFGPGFVHSIRPGGFFVVKLVWGATAFLRLTSLTAASVDNLISVRNPIQEAVRKVVLAEYAAQRDRKDGSHNQDNRIVLFTRPDSGPPRGVPLHISPLSEEPHFALPPATPLDPTKTKELYSTKNALVTHVDTPRDTQERLEETNADFDLRSRKRFDALKDLPFSWGNTDDAPWLVTGKGMSRQELEAWEQERFEAMTTKTELMQAESELVKQKSAIRSRDKRLAEALKAQEALVQKLTKAQAEACFWRHKWARLRAGDEQQQTDSQVENQGELSQFLSSLSSSSSGSGPSQGEEEKSARTSTRKRKLTRNASREAKDDNVDEDSGDEESKRGNGRADAEESKSDEGDEQKVEEDSGTTAEKVVVTRARKRSKVSPAPSPKGGASSSRSEMANGAGNLRGSGRTTRAAKAL